MNEKIQIFRDGIKLSVKLNDEVFDDVGEYIDELKQNHFWLDSKIHSKIIQIFFNSTLDYITSIKGNTNDFELHLLSPEIINSVPEKKRNPITDELFRQGHLKIQFASKKANIGIENLPPEHLIKNWHIKWSIENCLNSLIAIASENAIDVEVFGNEEFDGKQVLFSSSCKSSFKLFDEFKDFYLLISKLGLKVEHSLESLSWDLRYERDEQLFSLLYLRPLFQKMGFDSVRYNHGVHEYGKDFILSKRNKFRKTVHYGVQVKAGDVNGRVNSTIDELIGQIGDAFSMPFYELDKQSEQYISSFFIIISGVFTNNAQKKITHKITNLYGKMLGNISFIDKQNLFELSKFYHKKS